MAKIKITQIRVNERGKKSYHEGEADMPTTKEYWVKRAREAKRAGAKVKIKYNKSPGLNIKRITKYEEKYRDGNEIIFEVVYPKYIKRG